MNNDISSYKIFLKPVYSCPTSELPKEIKLPEKWKSLAWHQVETFNALNNPNIDVVFNTAMTGDGKSLAAYLRTFSEYYCAIALYPTNELARDQETQIKHYLSQFQPQHNPRIARLSGAELEIYAENEGLRKGAALSTRTSQSEIILTNPDILHYLHRGAYIFPQDSPDKLWGRIDKDFELFIFDEFHVFAAPQIASVINTMLLISCTNRGKKFLFLSATPEEDLIDRLRKANFRCRVIDPRAENKYQFPETPAQQEQLSSQHWRQVTRAVELDFIPVDSGYKSAETWLKENAELILAQFQQQPGSKGAIILNSIAAIKRLTPFFADYLQSHHLTVGENTGLSGKETREKSLFADLVLGTSTIDVGVDFKINFLIFESADAGNFIQRLGRLGRHDGYEKEGKQVEFTRFTAHALVPNFLIERLFTGESPPLITGEIYDRPSLQNIIDGNYHTINNFQGYYSRWAGVQSFKLFLDLSRRTIQQQYVGSRDSFRADCEQVFNFKLGGIVSRWKAWEADWFRLSGKKNSNPIAEDACSFRGSSPLQCGLYDLTEPKEGDRFKTYDLPGILSNLEIELWTEAGFRRSLAETVERTGKPIPKGRFEYCLAFMKLVRYREERSNWRFTYSGDLAEKVQAWQVQVLAGLEIWQPDNRWAGEINKKLRNQGLVCYLLPKPVGEIRLRLQLPMHFQLYPISDRYSLHDPRPPYSIAFGQSALLLDTLAYRFKTKGGDPVII